MRTLLVLSLLAMTRVSVAGVATFDDLALAPGSTFFPQQPAVFTSGGIDFEHKYTEFFPGCCFDAWTYTNETDTTTPGFTNQFSAIPGSGAGGSENYAVAFAFESQQVLFDRPTEVLSAEFTNTTYAFLAMKDGNDGFGFVPGPFGAGDFFKVVVTGLDGMLNPTGSVEVLLADGNDVVDEWLFTDLSSLGSVSGLSFSVEMSDTSRSYPTYFALDNLAVPAPLTLALLGPVLVGATWRGRGSKVS